LKKSISKPSKVYFISLGAVLLASVYPIYMGIFMLAAYLRNGGINAADYPKYIIPYTPICIALIACVALFPFVFKLCKKYALPAISVLAVLLYLGAELTFEKVTVFSETTQMAEENEEWSPDTIETWQWYMCIAPPLNWPGWEKEAPPSQLEQDTQTEYVPATVLSKNPLITEYSPVFKLHFYMISIIIILAILGVTYGFYKASLDQSYRKIKPLIVQLIAVLAFIGLCILACFTAFFRTGEIVISPISAILMTIFFLIFGITAGVYTGTWLYGKRKLFSMIIPSIVATVITIAMYTGEMVMMNWNLYRFGEGVIFKPIGACPLALVDILVIILSGAITYITLLSIRHKTQNLIAEPN
jgi:hypothetical protein